MTVSIEMGVKPNGTSSVVDLEELLATRLLVQGNSGSGKSHLLRRLMEQSAPWVQQVVIDPEGDFVSLADEFGHVVIEATMNDRELTMIAARVRQHRISVILNLEHLEPDKQLKAAAAFLNGLFDSDRQYWYPVLVVVDEAQLFAPSASGDYGEEARRLSLMAMTNLMCRGRKRGLAGIIATQRLAKLAKNVAAEASNFLMGRTFLDIDMARASDLLGMDRRQAEQFRNLERGQFISLGPAMTRRPQKVVIGEVVTGSRGGSPKLMPMPNQPVETAAELIFTATDNDPVLHNNRVAAPSAKDVMLQLSQTAASNMQAQHKEVVEAEPEDLFNLEEKNQQYQEIIAKILEDPEAAFAPVSQLYQDFQVRCRIDRLKSQDLAKFRKFLSVARAGVDKKEVEEGDWQQAEVIAGQLPEEMRGVYLLLAKAAFADEPCPADLDIAKAYGTRSPGRARWLLTHMEEQGFIICASDLRGNRIVTLPDIGKQTATK
ncbi:AAA-like domain protein [Pseudovibrio sp. W64]|uniref:ATP-binding protein n=1 Tax=unclassified Pseudovibrio TaxID=2627060 RepID=UPI000709F403|nr:MULTISPECIES: ATP-binding protein [unclassified Pseudovibrio]KZK76922.1 AAA-like domain protein [Pseudovibrio sp. W64]KZK84113.1 AAA-like domain protein [Pseudovibrio sp. Ad13]KZK86323.1 AAA-like domain protein [Pseudovibrio sp. Ad46]KZK92200.1 AAA-like domain protein [Pseudovibrio sp. Ad5]KZK96960.1 AAA-like domain protein [Pseudovibrio sp. W74]